MNEQNQVKIRVSGNGPYEVSGALPLRLQTIVADSEGTSREWREGKSFETSLNYSLCRCGHSQHKPFCDGSHLVAGFDGTETASRASYLDQAERIEGPEMALTDAPALCAYARFCDADGTIWAQVERTEREDMRESVVREGIRCPSGRLVAWSGQPATAQEPQFVPPSLGLVEDPHESVSGPIWVRGGVVIESADGTPYEVRNRVTLCRCGASGNKPFCDGSHASVGFRDGLASD